ncbi:MAG: hypothetical protein A3K19_10545 [Lentisphaerae bacterium RIFOXYB12_FULL_65_16]|nr:MAG: hypothetical protein A3K18_32990 [Lentisphaerae bacterium RIFOXYA12_64_32]OGV87948.1 MAG: hypothetical protein A3K19_10545 [Lentisphaerae bacterium RIFOXYB12_FULL_65_16]
MSELLVMHKRIDLDGSPVLYDRPFSAQSFKDDWEVRNSNWRCDAGALWGTNPLPGPGVVMTRAGFPGNVLMDFYAQTVLPSTHDIDVMWNLSWDEATHTRGPAYVAGVQGWWDGKIGIEKSPQYKLVATTPCPWFKPGQEYHIQAGSIDGHSFIFVDDVLRLELLDPDPIDSQRHNRVGFEAYQSMIRIRNLVVRQIVWEKRPQAYAKEF